MITMQSFNKNKASTLMSNINKDNSILIIGKGGSEYKLNEFIQPNSVDEMRYMFGESSELTIAYEEAKYAGASNIFVMNCYKTTDYVSSIPFVSQYNFAFVVPVGINLSDTFYSTEYEKEMYYAEYYLIEFNRYSNSIVIFTDEHASLYENIEHYLRDMHKKVSAFKQEADYLLSLHGRSLAFCANCLQSKRYANVILAAMISNTSIGQYPDTIRYEAVFDFNSSDFNVEDIIFFKNNVCTNTSIENLTNFRTQSDANKVIPIDRVIRHIERNLDTSFVVGKLYNQYVEMMLLDYLDSFLRQLLNSSIRNYEIKEIYFVPSQNRTGYIVTKMDIHPINSIEKLSVMLEVK